MAKKDLDFNDPELEELSQGIAECFLQSLILKGQIKVGKKTKEQLFSEMRDILKEDHGFFDPEISPSFGISVDYQEHFLDLANQFWDKKEYESSLIFYSIWFEHWVNGVILVKANLNEINEDLAKTLLRSPLDMKIEKIWKGLGLRKLKNSGTIKKMYKLRNEIVHYKYPVFDADDDVFKPKIIEVLKKFKVEIPALHKFYSKTFFDGRFDELFGKNP